MSTVELETVQAQVDDLREEVAAMRQHLSSLATMEPRLEAVEATARAQTARIDHMNRVVLSIQADIQALGKGLRQLEAAHTRKLDDIHAMQTRMLELLQPKAVL